MTYKELKTYFDETDLPETLRGEHRALYYKVEQQSKLWIDQVDSEIKRVGPGNIKSSDLAKTAKQKLIDLYNDLHVKENWDKGLYTVDEL